MVESSRYSTGLAGFDFEAASGSKVQIRAAEPGTLVNLRGRPDDERFRDAVRDALGTSLPDGPNRWHGNGERAILWLGPDEWLIMERKSEADAIESKVRECVGEDPWLSLVDVSHNYTGFELAGGKARDVLAKGCPLDLHPRTFGPGDCAQTLLAKTRVLLRHLEAEDRIEVWVRNSFARYAAAWLIDAMAEHK